MIGAILLTLLIATSLLAPWLSPRAPAEVDLRRRLTPPSWAAALGTDELGRSTLARVLHGGRVSLLVAVASVRRRGAGRHRAGRGRRRGAGPPRRPRHARRRRAADLSAAAPGAGLRRRAGPRVWHAAIAVALVETPVFARLTRGVIVVVRELPYVEAAVAVGGRRGRVMLRHVLPAAAGTIAVQLTLATGFAVVALSGLGFLGLGVQPPTADWGDMLARARHHLLDAPWLMLGPGVADTAAVLGCSLLGDALRDATGSPWGGASGAARPSLRRSG